jgi:hypothetical protein
MTSIRRCYLVAIVNAEDRFAFVFADALALHAVVLLAFRGYAGLNFGLFAFGEFVKVQPWLFRPEEALDVWIIRQSRDLAAGSAREGEHAIEAGEQVHGSAVRADLARHAQSELHFIERAPYIRRRNGLQDHTAFVAGDIRHVAALHSEEQTAALGIAEVGMGQDPFGVFARFGHGSHSNAGEGWIGLGELADSSLGGLAEPELPRAALLVGHSLSSEALGSEAVPAVQVTLVECSLSCGLKCGVDDQFRKLAGKKLRTCWISSHVC